MTADGVARGPIVPDGVRVAYDLFHFAPAFRAGDVVWVSGVIGVDENGRAPAGPDDEFAAAFAQLAETLAEAGCSTADIVELTSFHTDMPDTLDAFMAAKDAVIGEPYPAWTAIGCTALLIPGARAEIKATAVRRR